MSDLDQPSALKEPPPRQCFRHLIAMLLKPRQAGLRGDAVREVGCLG